MIKYFALFILSSLIEVNYSATDRFPRVTRCINQIQPNYEEISSFRRKELPKTQRGKCLLACYLEARNLMTSYGKYNAEGAAKVVAKAYPGNVVNTGYVRHILSHCGANVDNENDKCEWAARMAQCTNMLSARYKLIA